MKMSTVVRKANLGQDVKVYLKIVNILVGILVAIHSISCVWFLVTS
mgnify:CR=1 FL=1